MKKNPGSSPESTQFSGNLTSSLSNHFAPTVVNDDFISDYASKLLAGEVTNDDPGDGATASWIKKKTAIENILRSLPRKGHSCDFLLRVLRAANMLRVSAGGVAEIEGRISQRLDGASLEELMIPCFRHTGNTLLDVGLVLRLVRGFLNSEGGGAGGRLAAVAKLVDGYLAEAALDCKLELPEFMELLTVVPSRARQSDDGLYRAIDTYLKTHPSVAKQDKRNLCSLIDDTKLSLEAALHASQNERLPVRAAIKFLLKFRADDGCPTTAARCCLLWKKMANQQAAIGRLNDEVLMLKTRCADMEKKLGEEEKRGGFWMPFFGFKFKNVAGRLTPGGGSSSAKWRRTDSTS